MSSLVGKTIQNRYHVQEFLGRGGMAEVYKVWDNKRMTYLAMKVLLEDLALDRVFIRRFKREANTLEKLQHPNIVRFYGFEQQERLAFMLMDYIEGETLKHLIHDSVGKAIPFGEIRLITRSVCGALNYAHSQGFIHCDIKPANIMIDKNEVQLADFGIARMSDAATATMAGVGTPAYMAPEQVLLKDPVPQTDIYALGVVLHEMFTGGERPFTGEQAQVTGGMSERVRWEHVNLPPPSPKKWSPELSGEIEAVILRCLEKEPEKRYASALELSNALELALGNVQEKMPKVRTGKSRSPNPVPPQNWIKRFPWLVPVTILLIGIVIFFAARTNTPASSSSSFAQTPGAQSFAPNMSTATKAKTPTPTVYYTPTPIPTQANTPMNAAYLSSIFTETVEPRKESIPADYECADREKLYLSVGTWARTARYNMSIFEEIVDPWDISAEGIRALPEKERILVYDGPVCSSDGHTWWFVKTESSQFGWVIDYLSGGYGHFFNPMK